MKFLEKIIKGRLGKAWSHLGIFTELSVGIVLIAGTNGFALVYIPITFLAVPVASAGTLVGTFVCSNAFSRHKKQGNSEEVQSMLETEKLKKDLSDTRDEASRLRAENSYLKRQGMNAIEINPELKLTFLSMGYEKYDFYEDTIEKSEGTPGFWGKKPYEVKYQGIYYVKGTIDYEIDLSKLKVAQEGNTLIFCGEIKPEPNPRMTEKEEIVLKQEKRTTWHFDADKPQNRGNEEETVITDKIGESHINSPVHKKHRDLLRESLKNRMWSMLKISKNSLKNIWKIFLK